MSIGFLFDPYLPEFWYFEVVETLFRLAMTGLLSAVKPGSYTQLCTGIMVSGNLFHKEAQALTLIQSSYLFLSITVHLLACSTRRYVQALC